MDLSQAPAGNVQHAISQITGMRTGDHYVAIVNAGIPLHFLMAVYHYRLQDPRLPLPCQLQL